MISSLHAHGNSCFCDTISMTIIYREKTKQLLASCNSKEQCGKDDIYDKHDTIRIVWSHAAGSMSI